MLLDQPFMKFEIHDKVKHSTDAYSFNDLTTLELEPIVKIFEQEDQVEVQGHLMLNGEFLSKEVGWQDQYDQSDGIHYGPFFNKEGEIETFQHKIPLEIQISNKRIKDPSQIFIVVEHFDYQIVSEQEMELTAYIKLLGVHPEPKQENPVDFEMSNQNEAQLKEQVEKSNIGKIAEKNEEELFQDLRIENDVKEVDQKIFEDEIAEVTEEKPEEKLEEKPEEKIEAEFEVKIEDKDENTEKNLEVTKEDAEEKPEDKFEVTKENVEAKTEEKNKVILEQSDETTSKMKIGIKGKNRESTDEKEGGNLNPFYSLLNQGQKNSSKTNESDNETASVLEAEEKENINVVNEVKVNKELKLEASNKNKSSLDVESEESKLAENEQVDTEEVDDEQNKNAVRADNNTTDIIFSLLTGSEDKRHKLKICLVQNEETLEQIAEKYGLNSDEIISHNKLESYELVEGQLLYLPMKG